MMRMSPGALLLAVAVGVAAFTTGLLVQVRGAQDRAPDMVPGAAPEPGPVADGPGGFSAELRALRELLEGRALEAQVAPAPVQSRTPLGRDGGPELLAALDSRLASLTAAIERLAEERAPPAVAPPQTLQFPADDFEPLAFPVREEVSTTDFSRRHLYWTTQQVVDAYGLPAQVSATKNNEHVWSYPDVDGEDLEFVFHQGVLLRVEW